MKWNGAVAVAVVVVEASKLLKLKLDLGFFFCSDFALCFWYKKKKEESVLYWFGSKWCPFYMLFFFNVSTLACGDRLGLGLTGLARSLFLLLDRCSRLGSVSFTSFVARCLSVLSFLPFSLNSFPFPFPFLPLSPPQINYFLKTIYYTFYLLFWYIGNNKLNSLLLKIINLTLLFKSK